MASTTIDLTPTWDTATRIYLEVLRVNDWDSDAGIKAREELQRMAQSFDQAQNWIKEHRQENR